MHFMYVLELIPPKFGRVMDIRSKFNHTYNFSAVNLFLLPYPFLFPAEMELRDNQKESNKYFINLIRRY